LRFIGVEGTTFTVVAHLVAEDATYDDLAVRRAVSWLAELNQPTNTPDGRGRYAPPPLVVFIGGVLYTSAVAENVTIRWHGPWSLTSDLGSSPVPLGADVSIGFSAVPESFFGFASLDTSVNRRSVGF
jgi:hypothetical protein